MNNHDAASQLTEVTVESDHGTLTALARTGQGTPVVFVHGVMADAFAWTQVAKSIAPERPVLILNRRGRSPSASLNQGYGVDSEVSDLFVWLTTLDGPADLVGHSFGGLIAVEAVRQGAAVRSLVLYEPVAYPFGMNAMPMVTTAVDAGELDTAVEIINIALSGYTHEHVEELRSGPAWPKLMQLAAPASAELSAINSFTFAAPQSWTTPTTIIAGEHSRNRPPYGPSVDVFVEALQIRDVSILRGEDHLAHVTAPNALAQAINKGLDN